MTEHLKALAVSSLVLLAAGCGSAASTAGSGASGTTAKSGSATSTGKAKGRPKPCTLVSTAEVGSAFNVTMTPPLVKDFDNKLDIVCSYADKSSGVTVDVLLRDIPVTPVQLKAASSDAVPVSGIGDAAYWDAGRDSLIFTKGGVMVTVKVAENVRPTSEAALRSAAEVLAKTAAGRL